jgi:hypothetical protein
MGTPARDTQCALLTPQKSIFTSESEAGVARGFPRRINCKFRISPERRFGSVKVIGRCEFQPLSVSRNWNFSPLLFMLEPKASRIFLSFSSQLLEKILLCVRTLFSSFTPQKCYNHTQKSMADPMDGPEPQVLEPSQRLRLLRKCRNAH